MKLRNKKTGEIVPASSIAVGTGKDGKWYDSLAELNSEWEDYEEPTTYYYINDFGAIREGDVGKFVEDEIVRKEIGNYFETEEEAEKAVEKLKAWKRLRDKGISFEAKVIDGKWYLTPKAEPQQRTFDEVHDVFKDIMFIFGGEE